LKFIFAVLEKKQPYVIMPNPFLASYALANSSDFITSAHTNMF